jgi:hypothetical protein
MKQCPNCGVQIADESRFCAECGKEIPQGTVCPHCGASMNEGDVFCQNCGKKPTDTPIEANETAYKGEMEKKSGFKKYLPYILGAFVVLAVIGYFNSNDSSNEGSSTNAVAVDSTSTGVEASVSTKEAITKRLEDIFDDVAKGNINDHDEKYFSSDFNRIYNEVAEIDDRFAQEGSLGFWDFGFWDKSQENVKLSATIEDVYDVKDKEAMAKIAFKFAYFDGSSHTSNEEIKVVLENGKWVLDDLHGYKKQMKAFVEEYKDYQPSSSQNNLDWLQGHWVYEQGSYKGHFIIQGDKIIQYSSMNSGRDEATYTIDGDVLRASFSANDNIVVKIDHTNQRIDYGDGQWMRKVDSSNDSHSSTSSSNSSSRTFQSEQLVIGYLANQSFRSSDGLTMKVDGSGRLYVDGDYAGVLSVLRYNSTSALLRFGGGMYGEGKLTVNIVGDKFTLTDPTDGTVYYQR